MWDLGKWLRLTIAIPIKYVMMLHPKNEQTLYHQRRCPK